MAGDAVSACRGVTPEELERFRVALRDRVNRSTLRGVALEVDMSPSGLSKFMEKGTKPYAPTIEHGGAGGTAAGWRCPVGQRRVRAVRWGETAQCIEGRKRTKEARSSWRARASSASGLAAYGRLAAACAGSMRTMRAASRAGAPPPGPPPGRRTTTA